MSDVVSVQLLKKEKIAKNTWQFWFSRPNLFAFKPGQYTTVFLGKENRDFTVCADPGNKKTFSIVTKPGVSIFKKSLFALVPGLVVKMKKPSGGFVLQDTDTSPKVFLAGGIGITPFYSMIQDVCSKNDKRDITLIASFSKKDHMIFYDELMQIQKENKNVRIVYSLTQEEWDGETGRISGQLVKKYAPNVHVAEFLIAGGEQMVYDTEESLLQVNVPQEKIRLDIFTGY